MDQERYEKLRALFVEFRDLPPDQREDALDKLDPDIAFDLRAWFDADARTGPLDHPPAVAWTDRRLDAGAYPKQIGAYRLDRRLGDGSSGVVFQAERDNPRKRVAIKVLHLTWASEVLQARFEREGQILARLRHPAIAQVYEAGVCEHDGALLAWFALELVPGANHITTYCRERELPRRERLELFARVCDAVEHAHSLDIIHRDLKPANILIDSEGDPKVIDFGIARIDDPAATLLTGEHESLSALGTLSYMSPEQWGGHAETIDRRADVYALGVILYELLTDHPPFDISGCSPHEALAILHHASVPAPSKSDPSLRGNLDAITAMATARDREDRYQTADLLARDVRDHLSNRPTVARPPRLGRRLTFWARNHPILATLIACAAVIAPAFMITMSVITAADNRPSRIVLTSDKNIARIMSESGRMLHSWFYQSPRSILTAQLVDRPPSLGGGQVAVLAYSVNATDFDLAGHLAFYDPLEPAEPIWTTAQMPLQRPEGYENREGVLLDCTEAIIDDIFPSRPGLEIVTFQSLYPYSPVCIRIFDLAGNRLFEAWHDGTITSSLWLPDDNRLLLTGLNSEWRWDQRAVAELGGAYPRVAFAIEPRLHHTSPPWIVLNDQIVDPTVLWYKWFGPVEALADIQGFGLTVKRIQVERDADVLAVAALIPLGIGRPGNFHFSIDADGRPYDRGIDDPYKAALQAAKVPDPQEFELLPLASLPRPEPDEG